MRARLPLLVILIVGVLLVGVIVVAAIAPARIIGVSEETLAYSVEQTGGSGLGRQVCKKRENGEDFRCGAEASGANRAGFIVEVGDDGCWVARERRGKDKGSELEGCVEIGDYLRLSD